VQPRRLHVKPGEDVEGVLAAELQLPVLLVPVLVHIPQKLTVALGPKGDAARKLLLCYCF
jgi:hypothetical protein